MGTVSGEDGSDWLGVVWLLGKKERRILSWVYYYPWDIVFDASTYALGMYPPVLCASLGTWTVCRHGKLPRVLGMGKNAAE